MSCNNDEDLWRYALKENAEISLSKCMLDEGRENEGFPFCFYDGTTPVKDCGDLVVNDINSCERPVSLHNKIKEGLVGESSLQVKRRRTLLFEPEVMQVCDGLQDAQAINGVISELPQWVSDGVTDNSFEALDLSDEEWVAKFFNDTEMNLSSEKIDTSETSGSTVCQVTGIELDNTPSPSEANVDHDQFVGRRRNVVFKGRKSFMRAPSKSPASVVYPFDFIKPSDLRGDVTLKDINQKIRTPPPKPRSPDEDLSVRYPKSAFSGKPVVGKTKICMEGGKGSITIMRTMG